MKDDNEQIDWYPLPAFNDSNIDITLFAAVNITESGLLFQYRLLDPQKVVEGWGPQNKTTLARRHELWKATCFEAFWAIPGEEKYWELNVNTQNQYNIYSFDAYRSPQPPKEDLEFFVAKIQQKNNILQVWVEGPFPRSALSFSLCAILKLRAVSGGQSTMLFMSNQHNDIKPDFHLRQGFSIVFVA